MDIKYIMSSSVLNSIENLPDEDFCRRCGAYNKEKEYV